MQTAAGERPAWKDSETVRHATPEQKQFYAKQGYLKISGASSGNGRWTSCDSM